MPCEKICALQYRCSQNKIVDFGSEFSLRVLAKSTILWFKTKDSGFSFSPENLGWPYTPC